MGSPFLCLRHIQPHQLEGISPETAEHVRVVIRLGDDHQTLHLRVNSTGDIRGGENVRQFTAVHSSADHRLEHAGDQAQRIGDTTLSRVASSTAIFPKRHPTTWPVLSRLVASPPAEIAVLGRNFSATLSLLLKVGSNDRSRLRS